MIDFTYNYADSLDIGPAENQVGVIIFGYYSQVVFNLSTYSDKRDLLTAINTIPYIGWGTNTAEGLRVLIEEGFTEENGARLSASNVYRLAIVMTDGRSDDGFQTKEVAGAVHNFHPSILVFAIGVTDSIDTEELKAIAIRDEYITFLSNFMKVSLWKPETNKSLSSVLRVSLTTVCTIKICEPLHHLTNNWRAERAHPAMSRSYVTHIL